MIRRRLPLPPLSPTEPEGMINIPLGDDDNSGSDDDDGDGGDDNDNDDDGGNDADIGDINDSGSNGDSGALVGTAKGSLGLDREQDLPPTPRPQGLTPPSMPPQLPPSPPIRVHHLTQSSPYLITPLFRYQHRFMTGKLAY
ncbi:hypothetical protein EDD18DRAFT_1109673 [Armillaria luteobubalina]|uniref:Uncharacterized protein n=1 Tax=Armillaria luteobubalina TaxID=153913 RepID=A0AA39TI77_9AGAR|nr:hypothetical protein EDD18DRAFT_1109673 [Armillaria luteobubalina]